MPKNKKKQAKPRKVNRLSFYRTKSIGLIALLLAIIAAAFFFSAASSPRNNEIRIAASDDSIMLPLPARAIARGEKLENVPFTEASWPRSRVPGQVVEDLEAYKQGIALTSIPKLVPIPISSISLQPVDNNIVAEGIPPGMRAITLKVDTESAIEGWARSGNFVDVVVLRIKNKGKESLEAKVIAENVRILSAGRSAKPKQPSATFSSVPASVTLLVSQEDALKIKTASSLGRITFTMRGLGDALPTLVKSMNQNRLLGGTSGQALAEKFKGMARGPNGNTWVLSENSHWMKKGPGLSIKNSFLQVGTQAERDKPEKNEARNNIKKNNTKKSSKESP